MPKVEMSWSDAIVLVLKEARGALHYTERENLQKLLESDIDQ